MWPQLPTEAAGMMLLYLRGTSSLPSLFLDRFPEPRRVRFACLSGSAGRSCQTPVKTTIVA